MKTMQAAVVLGLCLAAAPAVRAQPAPRADAAENEALSDKARQLFVEGVDALKRGRWAEAHASFLAAWRIKPHYQIASNLGASEVNLGKYRDAAEHLGFYLREAPKTKEKERQRAQALLDEALSKLVRVTLVDLPDGAEVKVDGALVGKGPLAGPLYLEPGEHALDVRLDGFAPLTRALRGGAGEAQEIAGRLERPAVVAPVVPVVEKRPMWPAIVGGALAAGGIAAGAGLAVAANGKAANVAQLQSGERSTCFMPSQGQTAACMNLHSAAASKTTLSNASASAFLVGGVFAAAGAGMAIWAALTPKGVAVQAVPTVGATHLGLALQGEW